MNSSGRRLPYADLAAPLVVTAFVIAWLRGGSFGWTHTIGWAGLAAAVIAVVATRHPRRAHTGWLILGGTGALMLALSIWNTAYWGVLQTQPLNREVFRRPFRTPYAPVYGLPQDVGRFAGLVVVATTAAFAGFVRRVWRSADVRPWAYVLLLTLQAALTLAAAFAGRGGRLSGTTPGYALFAADAAAFGSAADLLRTYVERMPELGWFAQHYPPGILWLIRLDLAFGFPVTLGVTLGSCLLATLAVGRLAETLGMNRPDAFLAAAVFAASAGVVTYPTINPSSIVLGPAAVGTWLATRAAVDGGDRCPRRLLAAGGLGVVWPTFFVLSFAAGVFGLMLAACLVLGVTRGAIRVRVAAEAVIAAGTVAVVVLGSLYLTSGFDAVACFRVANALHHAQQMHGGFDTPVRYLLRSGGNGLAYLFATIPLSVLTVVAAWQAWRDAPGPSRDASKPSRDASGPTDRGSRTLTEVLALSVVGSIAVAAFSGSFFGETERIWVFFTPALAVVATRLAARDARTFTLLAVVLIVTAAKTLTFMPYRP